MRANLIYINLSKHSAICSHIDLDRNVPMNGIIDYNTCLIIEDNEIRSNICPDRECCSTAVFLIALGIHTRILVMLKIK